ncbi:uncharacterized protein LOC129601257 isoform X2 [Paramacrobiotus metropolitanus]|uniref:uncharacterized protein LOC129601257 isoform X2 n=1 Tax=Paramacrobiotus metropolitanus TaxID=2943436 RepID=UPI0024462026|nr:uncharacterized protein LOC129601257 isoform X2 [Paramacrobiotus metropolitanus]
MHPLRREMMDGTLRRILLAGMLATVISRVARGDSAGQPLTTLQRAALAVQQAEANMTDNVVILPSFKDAAAGAPPPVNIVRVPLGATATFSCDTASGQSIIWRFHNDTIRGDVAKHSPKGHYYRLTSNRNTSRFLIHNMTRDAAGTVECLLPCHDDADLCVLRQFELQLQQRAQEVFTEPMRNVSTPLWSFSMTCTGRVDCSQAGYAEHFIWKFDERFLVAPYRYLQTIAGNSHVDGLRSFSISHPVSEDGAADPVCSSTLTIAMAEVVSNWSARVDCWLRTDVRRHEWFVQSAYVHFTPFAALDDTDL